MRLYSTTVLAVLALGLSAQASTFAIHPSEIVDADAKLRDRLHALVASEMVRRGFDLVPSGEVDKVLASRGAGGCSALVDKERTQCLADLASKTGAQRAVLFTIAPFAGDQVVLTTQVVSASGVVVQELPPYSHKRAAKEDPQDAVRAALRELVPKIEVPDSASDLVAPLADPNLNPSNTTPTTDPNTVVTAPPEEPTKPPSSRSGVRTALGYGTAAVGLALLGGGGFSLVRGNQEMTTLDERYRNNESFSSQDVQHARRFQTLGIAGIGLGAAAVAGGAFLLATSGGEDEPEAAEPNSVSWNVLIGPGHAGVHVRFP